MNKNVIIGLCPIGKFVFSNEDAIKQKKAIQAKLKELNVDFIDLEGVLPDGLVKDQNQVTTVVKHFKDKIDALFVPHCNFGTEGAVGIISRDLGVPVVLWGPRDDAPLEDGSRLRDSLCGMFASSKVIRKLKVPFTYIENCYLNDELFTREFLKFVRAAAVVKAFRTLKIGQIGERIDFFWTTIDNESELLEKFSIEMLPIEMVEFVAKTKEKAVSDKAKYMEELPSIRKWLSGKNVTDSDIITGLAYRDKLIETAKEYDLSVFSIKSFNYIPSELGVGSSIGDALAQETIPISPESDIHGAISSVMLDAAKKTAGPIFSPEFTVRHPENDNAVLLWHASTAPSLRSPDNPDVKILPPWILKNLPATSFQYKLKDGPLTVCRFDGDTGDYVLGLGEGHTVDGPVTREVYSWMEVDNWPVWERKIMEGPYIHHCSAAYDHCADVLEEACKYIPGLRAERFDGSV